MTDPIEQSLHNHLLKSEGREEKEIVMYEDSSMLEEWWEGSIVDDDLESGAFPALEAEFLDRFGVDPNNIFGLNEFDEETQVSTASLLRMFVKAECGGDLRSFADIDEGWIDYVERQCEEE